MSRENSYRQILRSSSIMGGAAGLVMLFGLIRIKFAAVLLGVTGIGLIASFTAIQALIATLSGLGLSSSAVREIAAAVGKDDQPRIIRSVSMLHRLSLISGLVGMCLLIISSPIISTITFGSYKYTVEIALLGLVVFLSNLSASNIAVLQGLRRIPEMARANTYSAATGTFCAIVFFYFMELRGIVPALVSVGLAQYAITRYFLRKNPIAYVKTTWRETYTESKSMICLGFTFMWSALLVSLVGYITIYLINRFESVQMVGIYSAAFALSGIFVGFVLNAMSADYYPRLTAVANNNDAMQRLVTEQTEIGVLLAVPGLLASIVFAPWLVQGLYSKEFMSAVPMLQWFIFGCLGRVISWPMGFVILAMGKDRWFFVAETIFNIVHISIIAFAMWLFGIEGIAFAFCIVYVAHTIGMYIISKRLIGFRANSTYAKLVFGSVILLSLALIISRELSEFSATFLGLVLVVISFIYSLRSLIKRIDR